jgi:hypothetical protein
MIYEGGLFIEMEEMKGVLKNSPLLIALIPARGTKEGVYLVHAILGRHAHHSPSG